MRRPRWSAFLAESTMFVAYQKPLRASAHEGEVVITGEGNVCGSFTPEAVIASLDSLRDAAEQALRQQDCLTGEDLASLSSLPVAEVHAKAGVRRVRRAPENAANVVARPLQSGGSPRRASARSP